MWFAWTVLSILQVYTSRYLKHYWKWRYAIHSVVGMLSLIFTLAGSLIIIKWLGWSFVFTSWHNRLGTLFMVLGMLLCLAGVYTLVLKRYMRFEWATIKMLRLAAIHKYLGYFVILTVQLAVATGIIRRVTSGG